MNEKRNKFELSKKFGKIAPQPLTYELEATNTPVISLTSIRSVGKAKPKTATNPAFPAQNYSKRGRRKALFGILSEKILPEKLLKFLSKTFREEDFLEGRFFMVYEKQLPDKMKRLLFLMKNLFLIHLVVILVMALLTLIQKIVDNICFVESVCECKGWAMRLYTGVKKAFDTWFFGQLAIYLNLFCSPKFNKYKLAKISIFAMNFLILIIIFLTEKDKHTFNADLGQRANVFSVINSVLQFLYIGIWREKMKVLELIKQFWVPFWALFIFYSYLLSYLYLLPEIKFIIVSRYPSQGYNIFQIFCTVLNSIYLTLFFFFNKYYSAYLKRVGADKTPQIVVTKFFIALHFSMVLAAISQLRFDQLGFWVSLCDYFFLILRYHTSFNVLGDTILWAIFKIFNKRFVPDWKIDVEFYRIVGYLHIEMILVYIPRIVNLMYLRRFFITGVKGESFIKNCSLEMIDSLSFNLKGVHILMALMLISSFLLFLISRQKGHQLNIMHFESLRFFVRVAFIISLHSNIEFYFILYRSI